MVLHCGVQGVTCSGILAVTAGATRNKTALIQNRKILPWEDHEQEQCYNIYTYIIYGAGKLSVDRGTGGYKAWQAAASHKQLDETDKNLLSAEGRLWSWK